MKKSLAVVRVVAGVLGFVMACSSSSSDSSGGPDGGGPDGEGLPLDGGGSDAGGPSGYNIPAITPIARDATPGVLAPPVTGMNRRFRTPSISFIPTAHAAPAFDISTVAGSLQKIFQDQYTRVSGGRVTGLINAAMNDVDGRFSGVQAQIVNSKATCLTSPASSYHMNATNVAAALDMTLSLQCSQLFGAGGPDSGPNGSGLIFGKNNDDYSLWLYLYDTNNLDAAGAARRVGYFANVKSSSTADKSLDVIEMESDEQRGRADAYRVKAVPSTHTFEFTYAASQFMGLGLECGFRMISDGNLIAVEGKHMSAAGDCATADTFNGCYKAANLDPADFPDAGTDAGSDAGDDAGTDGGVLSPTCKALRLGYTIQSLQASDMNGAAFSTFDGELDIKSGSSASTPLFN